MAITKPLSITHPFVAAMAHNWDPSKTTAWARKMGEWKCHKGHVWTAPVSRVVISHLKGRSGCPYCAGKKIKIGENDLQTTHPEIAESSFGWDPTSVTAKSGKRREWKCALDHVWSSMIASRTVNGNGCPYCANQDVWPGFNDLTTTDPTLASQAYGWDPSTLVAGSNKRLKWKCEFNHVWKAMVSERSRGTGCPDCYEINRRTEHPRSLTAVSKSIGVSADSLRDVAKRMGMAMPREIYLSKRTTILNEDDITILKNYFRGIEFGRSAIQILAALNARPRGIHSLSEISKLARIEPKNTNLLVTDLISANLVIAARRGESPNFTSHKITYYANRDSNEWKFLSDSIDAVMRERGLTVERTYSQNEMTVLTALHENPQGLKTINSIKLATKMSHTTIVALLPRLILDGLVTTSEEVVTYAKVVSSRTTYYPNYESEWWPIKPRSGDILVNVTPCTHSCQ